MALTVTSQTEGLIPFSRPNDMQTSIDVMPDEILLHIFSLNANMKDDTFLSEDDERCYRALYITRRTSHVSQRWRELLLRSPTIWAGLIDLDMFRMDVANDWREEVIRRSGAVLLSVKGYLSHIAHPRLVEEKCLFPFLDKYWDRIQNLNIVAESRGFDREAWLYILCRPSPHLRSFDLRFAWTLRNFHRELFPNRNRPDAILFSNHAPSLREFHRTSMTRFVPAPWLSHLRVLELMFEGQGGCVLTVAHILTGLAGMSLLEHLIIDIRTGHWTAADNPDETIHCVNLPRLRHMNVKSQEFKHCLLLLDNIVPRQGCSLFLYAISSRGETDQLQPFTQMITQHSQNYFCFGGVTPLSIELQITERTFEFASHMESWSFTPFEFSRNPYRIEFPHNYLDRIAGCPVPDFRVKVYQSVHPPPPVDLILFSSVISPIPVAALGLVTTLKFTISARYFTDWKVDPLEVVQFIASLTSVETLATNIHTLEQLNCLHIRNSKSLPVLRTLKMMGSLLTVHRDDQVHSSIPGFLKFRAEAGLSIEVLDLTMADLEWVTVPVYFLECLEAMAGLKIFWKHGEEICQYVCKAGKPGLLGKAS